MENKIIKLKTNSDDRGKLTAIEDFSDIPFAIKRIFYMHDITSNRGGHAHLETNQLLIAIAGSFQVSVFDGKKTLEFFLENPSEGLLIPKMHFVEMINFSKNAVALVLADSHYEIEKSLRSMEDFKQELKG